MLTREQIITKVDAILCRALDEEQCQRDSLTRIAQAYLALLPDAE